MTNYAVRGGTGLVVDGEKIVIPGIDVVNFGDAPQLAMSHEDGEPRHPDEEIRLIVLHTTTGEMPQHLQAGTGPSGDLAERNAYAWAHGTREASAHLVIDWDGQVIQTADLVRTITYHAGDRTVNHRSIGIELAFGRDHLLYESQMNALMTVLDLLTRHPKIPVPRQFATGHWPIPDIGTIFRGIISHRDVGNRGEGDCGPVPYSFLSMSGYEALNVGQGAHTILWKTRQGLLNQWLLAGDPHATPLALDGDPGPATWAMSKRFKSPFGQWVRRPGD